MKFPKGTNIKKPMVLLSILLFSFYFGSIASAYVLKPWHIASGSTRIYYVGSDISSDGIYSITVSDNQWNGISNRHVYFSQSATRTSIKTWTENNKTEIFKESMGTNAGFIARTGTWQDSTGHYAIESDTCINTSFNLSNSVPPPSGSYCLKTLMTHEMGHMVGFEHSNYTSKYDAIMAYGMPDGISTYTLKIDDINGYNNIHW